MGKTGKWLKNIWAGKKHNTKQKNSTGSSSDHTNENQNLNQKQNPSSPVLLPATPTKDKKRWSFRRSSATSPTDPPSPLTATASQEKTELAVAGGEDNAALKIQSVFRSYLARKALKALRGLVKLQALVRGHLVRKQATATLRCMQALVTAQARARAQRIRIVEDAKIPMLNNRRHSANRRTNLTHPHFHDIEENIKIVEMDHAEHNSSIKIRNSCSNPITDDRTDDKISTYYTKHDAYSQQIISPAPSATTDISPRTCSGYFEDYTFPTAQTSPQCYSTTSKPDPSTQFTFPRPDSDYSDIMSYDYPLYPNYMSNTQSSRAKARSQSAPKQRPEYERQPSRGRRTSIEGRGVPKGARMQRSSSQVGSTTGGQYPWSVKLDKSMVSVVESECGSNYSVLTNANYYGTSVVSYDPRY